MILEQEILKPELQPEVLHLDAFVKIEMDSSKKLLSLEWLQHPDSNTFRKNFNRAAQLAIEHKILFWLSDSRAIHYLEFADQNWMMEQILPLLPKATLLKFARITTLESMAMLDVSRIFNSLEQMKELTVNVKLEEFTDKDAAMGWLFHEM